MFQPFLLIGSIIALAVCYILLPQYLGRFLHYRKPRKLTCPEKGTEATVGIASHRAALTSLFDSEQRRVKHCSLLLGEEGCDMGCLKSL